MGIENPTLDEAIAHCRERLTRYHCKNHPTAPIPVYQQHLTVLLDSIGSKLVRNLTSSEQLAALSEIAKKERADFQKLPLAQKRKVARETFKRLGVSPSLFLKGQRGNPKE